MIYLDSAATTLQKPAAVGRAMLRALSTMASPGRGEYGPSARAARTVLACREEAAALFQVSDPERVVLTFNATHGLNIAVKSMVRPGSTVLLSGYEHNAVTRPLASVPNVTVKVIRAPLFHPAAFLEEARRQLTPEVSGVICTHVSNVFGYILPVEELAALCRRRGIPLLVDASQSAGVLPIAMEDWGAEFIAMPGHKALYGPQGTGLLLCKHAETVLPLLEGGTGSLSRQQEMPADLPDRLEAGTHNVPGAAGLLEGLRFVRRRGLAALCRQETELKELAADGLSRLPGVRVFRCREGNQTGVLSFQAEGRDPGELGEALSANGVAVRSGLHCSPAAHETVGTDSTGTVRISFSAFSTDWEVERFVSLLSRLV